MSEKKFQDRWHIIKYVWEIDTFKTKFRQLAEDIECEQLFLRFINLLINDAIFLLDEGLNYMKQIQEKEGEREGWAELPAQERTEAERGFQHTGQLARYIPNVF